MDYSSPSLRRQRSCTGWYASGGRRFSGEHSYDKLDYLSYSPRLRRSVSSGWLQCKGLWKKIMMMKKKNKRGIFDSSAHPGVGTKNGRPYDSYTYAQNFDEGSAWVEPENLSRSFSARFAATSGVLKRFG